MNTPPYASAREVVSEALSYIAPPERISTAEFAAKHRKLSNEGGGHVGLWSNDIAPYAVGIMDAFDDPKASCIAIVGPGQSSKTELACNYLFKTIAAQPADTLWYMNTDKLVEAFVKDRIDGIIDDHDIISRRLGRRSTDNSIHFKRFRGMKAEFLSANRSNLISKSAARIIADEIDAYDPALGNVKDLLDVRRQTYGSMSKLIMISHPDAAGGDTPDDWAAGIMQVYRDTDRQIWYWPCPRCDQWSSPAPIAQHFMELKWPAGSNTEQRVRLQDVERGARLICPHCSGEIENDERRAMNRRGKWVSSFQEVLPDGTVVGEPPFHPNKGFWITGTMSPFVFGGIGGLARAMAKAEQEMESTGDASTLKQVTCKLFGFPFSRSRHKLGEIDANTLAERAERGLTKGLVPAGVRFITVAVDVQATRFELLARGWGVQGESWIIDHEVIKADPSSDLGDWDKMMLRGLRAYKLADNSGRMMRPKALIIDSSGAPGVTQNAYASWLKWKKQGYARLLGKVDGHDCWSIILSKGSGNMAAPRLRVNYPESQRPDRKARTGGTIPICHFNANTLKDDLGGQINPDGGPWSIHFPYWMNSPEPPHRLYEQIVSSEKRLPTGRWESIPGAKNEMLDLMILTNVAAALHGLSTIDWDNPPKWAGDWDNHTHVVSAEVGQEPKPKMVGSEISRGAALARALP